MGDSGAIIVLDVGKTLAKLSLWSADGVLLEKMTRPNARCEHQGVAVLDVDGIGAWVIDALREFAAKAPVSDIIPVGHGAGIAAIRDGRLAFPPLDYEQPIPDEVLADYRQQRDAFADTGSPALPLGLNIGSQLHWLEARDSACLDGATLLPWAQYWSWFLSGTASSEVTSLGCHSDLWFPAAGGYSALAKKRGWAQKFSALAKAGDVVGTLRPALAHPTGLSPDTRIRCGIHDSNAALVAARGFAEIADSEATVLSTGTWFVALRSPKEPVELAALPEARDCLVNVDAQGAPVPSARFMGGREIELLGERIDVAGTEGLVDVLAAGSMILPSFVAGSGPFPDARGRWLNRLPRNRAAVALYLALMADTSLDLIGAKGTLLIDGRFATSELFTRALATLRPDMRLVTADGEVDVSFGALRLIDPGLRPKGALAMVEPLPVDLESYKRKWNQKVEGIL